LGLNHLYGTWWFIGLLGLFALSTATCALWGARFTLRRLPTLTAHLSILFIVAGAILRGVAGVDGMITIEKGQTADSLTADTGAIPLGFRLRLDDFVMRFYNDSADLLRVRAGAEAPLSIPVKADTVVKVKPDGTTLTILRYEPHFIMDAGQIRSASDQPVNPAAQVQLTGPAGEAKRWLFARFPDFHGAEPWPGGVQIEYVSNPPTVKAYESHVTVLDETGKEIRKAVILVNSPLKVGRYTLYQVGYDLEGAVKSTLEATHDPGVPLVFLGFILLPVGMALAFYAKPYLNRKGRKDV
jgi:cytochrome c biogenesis protein